MKNAFPRNSIRFLCLAGMLLTLGAPAAHAIEHGRTKWSLNNNKAHGDRNGSWVNYIQTQGAQGTHWVWRVQKYYPEFTLYCSTGHSSGCTANKTESRFESVTTQINIGVSLKGEFASQGGSVGFDYSRAWTRGSSFTIGQTISIQSGHNAYAMIIATDKYIPAADWGGSWRPTGRSRCANELCHDREYEFRWDNNYVFGTWRGHMVTHHRSYMCATRTTTEPRVGDGVPSGCSLPPIPY